MSQNTPFTTAPFIKPLPIHIELKESQVEGEVLLVATDAIGKLHTLGAFRDGRLNLVCVCDDAKRVLGIQTDSCTGCLVAKPISA